MDKDVLRKELSAADYEFYGLWRQDVFSAEFWVSCYTKEIPEKIGIVIPEQGTMVLTGGNFLLKNAIRKCVQDQFDAKIIAEDGTFFDRMVSVYNEVFQSVEGRVRELVNKNVSVETADQLFSEFYRINAGWLLAASHLVHSTERLLQDQVVKERFPAEKVPAILPKVETPLTQFQEEIKKLRIRLDQRPIEVARNDRAFWADLVHVAEVYAWVETANFIGDALTPERLFELVSHPQGKQLEEHFEGAVSPTLHFRAKCMSQGGYMKQASAEFFSQITRMAIPYLVRVAETLGITYRDLIKLRHGEIISGLEGGISKKDLLDRADRRKDMYWVMYTDRNNKTVFYEEKDLVQVFVDELLPEVDSGETTMIKGQIANPGKVTGTVRVIMNTDEFSKMRSGDVLVTTMTTPDFVLLMQQSSAIVTDIGGLLCHAAIVSRELNKPCIIGTKIATQVFKNGDYLEVDADAGIVKILNK